MQTAVMTQEQELGKHVHHEGENTKVAIRNVRRDGMEALKADENKKEISEDERKRAEADVQKL